MLSSILNLIFFILNSNIFFAQIFSNKHFSRSYSYTKWVLYVIDVTMIKLLLQFVFKVGNILNALQQAFPYRRYILHFLLDRNKEKSYSLNLLFILNKKKIALHSIFCLPTFLQCRSLVYMLYNFLLFIYLFIQYRKNGNLLVRYSEVVDFFIKICYSDCFFFH